MRLPTIDNQPAGVNIDEKLAIRMIRHAIDKGVNYVDTAYPYHKGNSEIVTGKALQDGYRDRIMLATKLPVWLINEPADFDRLLAEQMQKLSTDHIDFYLFHALNKRRWTELVLKHNLLKKAQSAVNDGRIRYIGFSFHDSYDVFEEIVKNFDWSFCQIQYNYMDIRTQAGRKGLKLAARKGLGILIMEPLMGGHLAKPPAGVKKVMDTIADRHTPADLALQWLWDQPEVSLVLSGMSSIAQVDENLQSAEKSGVNSLYAHEQKIIAEIRKEFRKRIEAPCTGCEYCMPCPNGVNIPVNFELFNYAHLYEDKPVAQFRYNLYLAQSEQSDKCIACKECEEKCPQDIEISTWMPRITAMLSEKNKV